MLCVNCMNALFICLACVLVYTSTIIPGSGIVVAGMRWCYVGRYAVVIGNIIASASVATQ